MAMMAVIIRESGYSPFSFVYEGQAQLNSLLTWLRSNTRARGVLGCQRPPGNKIAL